MKYDRENYDPADYQEEGICLECGEICTVKTIDEGIGPYEFWGAKGTHHNYVKVSSCCEVEFDSTTF